MSIEQDHNIDEQPPEELHGGIYEPIPTRFRRLAEIFDESHQVLLEKSIENLLKKELLPTTKSRATLCLIKFRKNIEKRYLWTIPCSLFLGCFSIFITIIANNQNEISLISGMPIPKNSLEGGFGVLTVGFFFWMFWRLFHGLRSSKLSEKDILNKMDVRNESEGDIS